MLAFGDTCIIQHGMIGGKTIGMKISQFMIGIHKDGFLRFARSANRTQNRVGKRMTKLDKKRFHLIIVVIQDNAFHLA